MKIGLFGGSFDPFHDGHLSIINGALSSGAVDFVIVIPSVRNAFKRGRVLNAAPYRYYMTNKAVSQSVFSEKIYVSDIEFEIPGISYTVNTIREIKKPENITNILNKTNFTKEQKKTANSYYWICGSDILTEFDKWKDPEGILSEVTLLAAQRPGDDSNELATQIARLNEKYSTDIKSFQIVGVKEASSKIRIGKNLSQVPESVKAFILENALYPDTDYLEKVSDEAIEAYLGYACDLYPILSERRLLHSLNVACLAVQYAVIHGVSPDKALIAGVLHDCAKELPSDEQREYAMVAAGPLFDNEKLWHSPAGSIYARKRFAIDDEEILNAIFYHTTGHSGMTKLEKIIFLADKLEPARTYSDLTLLREEALENLDNAMLMCMAEVSKKFKKKGREMHPYSLECIDEIKAQLHL